MYKSSKWPLRAWDGSPSESQLQVSVERLNLSDKALVRRFLRQNDGESFSILMERYADLVYTTCRRILREEALAADAVQENFFQLAKNAEKINGSLGSWLHKVATRRCLDLIRRATWTLNMQKFLHRNWEFH